MLKNTRAVDSHDNCIQWTQAQVAKKAGVSQSKVAKTFKTVGLRKVRDCTGKLRYMLDPDKAFAWYRQEFRLMWLLWQYQDHKKAVSHRKDELRSVLLIEPQTGEATEDINHFVEAERYRQKLKEPPLVSADYYDDDQKLVKAPMANGNSVAICYLPVLLSDQEIEPTTSQELKSTGIFGRAKPGQSLWERTQMVLDKRLLPPSRQVAACSQSTVIEYPSAAAPVLSAASLLDSCWPMGVGLIDRWSSLFRSSALQRSLADTAFIY